MQTFREARRQGKCNLGRGNSMSKVGHVIGGALFYSFALIKLVVCIMIFQILTFIVFQ